MRSIPLFYTKEETEASKDDVTFHKLHSYKRKEIINVNITHMANSRITLTRLMSYYRMGMKHLHSLRFK